MRDHSPDQPQTWSYPLLIDLAKTFLMNILCKTVKDFFFPLSEALFDSQIESFSRKKLITLPFLFLPKNFIYRKSQICPWKSDYFNLYFIAFHLGRIHDLGEALFFHL